MVQLLLTIKFLGHEIGNNTIRPISSKVDGIQKLKALTSKTELMLLIGKEIETSLSKDAELVIPNTTHSFYVTVDTSLIGVGAILFQLYTIENFVI